jgi:hypothetical protein
MSRVSKADDKILECVDSALRKLGESVSKSIYYYLKKDFNLERSEILDRPEIFEKALTSTFGKQGAKMIEKLIMVEIGNSFQLRRGSSLTFKEAVVTIKSSTCT